MTAADDDAALAIEVRRGAPSEEELAALIAVVSEAYIGEAAAAVVQDAAGPNAWSMSRRSLRTPLPRGLRWGAFGG